MTSVPLMSLADIAESVQYGYTASASDSEVGPKFLRITDIVPPQIHWATVPYCEIDDKNLAKFALEQGDIVVARTGATVGYAKLLRDTPPSVFASYLVRIRVDPEKADAGYVGRIVESNVYKRFVLSRVGGAAQPNANAKVLSSFRLPIPESATQRRIASILCAYDHLIENNRRRIQLLEQAARLLYKEWFVDLRFPGHENVAITDGVPEGWERKTAYDVMDIVSGGTPSTQVPDYWDGEIPFYTPKDYTDAAYVLGTERSISERGLSNCNSSLYTKNTVFISARGTVGKIIMAQRRMAMSQTSYALRGKKGVPQLFLYVALKTILQEFQQRATGAVFNAIVMDTFKTIPFMLRSRILIGQFEGFAIPIFAQIENLLLATAGLEAARDLLLPRLMNGEVVV